MEGRAKHFRKNSRPRNSRERNWSTRQMSARVRSILICRKGRSLQRRRLNGSKNRMTPIRLEQADRFREDRVDLPKQKAKIYLAVESEMSKKPKIDHEYHAHKDKMTIKL